MRASRIQDQRINAGNKAQGLMIVVYSLSSTPALFNIRGEKPYDNSFKS